MASSITTAVTVPSSQMAAIETQYAETLTAFQRRCLDLANRPLTIMTAKLAQELDSDAKAFIDKAEQLRTFLKAPSLESCKRIDGFFAELGKKARAARFLCTGVGAKEGGAYALRQLGIDPTRHTNIIGAYNLEQRRLAAEKKIADDRAALAQAEAAKKAEVGALIDLAANGDPAAADDILAEAQALDAAPVVPVLMPALPPPKAEGSSTSYKIVGEITDLEAHLRWILEGKRFDVFRELWGEQPKPSGAEALLRRTSSINWVGAAVTVENAPPGFTAQPKANTSNRSR